MCTKPRYNNMKLYSALRLKFEKANWLKNPEFGLLDTILDLHPELLLLIKADVLGDNKNNHLGRGDVPSLEQIMRAAIYKELKGYQYRELAYAQIDSRICEQFVKIDKNRPYSFQMYQKYISRISDSSLQNLLLALNKIAINAGLEDIKKIRQDSTVVETNIHYPTNNSLIWDCIERSHKLLSKLKSELPEFGYINYLKSAKRTYFKINVTKGKFKKEKQKALFYKQLNVFTKTINNLSNAVKKKSLCKNSPKALALLTVIENFIPLCRKVYSQAERFQIQGEKVPNSEKIFSIYEEHTSIICKGGRVPEFGHKVDLVTGKSNLILACQIFEDNISDKVLYIPALKRIQKNYAKIPNSAVTDGGYASKANSDFAKGMGIKNIVFNKVTQSMKNMASSLNMETRLKKWRSGIEANISNLKRGCNLRRVTWRGFEGFKAKVLWSVIAYNIRVMTRKMLLE